MAGTNEYIKQFGDVPFTERPFGDADNIALCEVFYMPLEKVVSESFDEEPRVFEDVCNELFELNGCEHKAVGLMLNRAISEKLMKMASTPRFSPVRVVACKHVYNESPAVQFDAATFILPDGVNTVVFRGTDDTIAGWKEDLDIYTKKYIPSYGYSVEYLENVAKNLDGDIIVCGHSKGGNVALYAALNCSPETADRIKLLYNNDGPGFHDLRPFATPAYRELLPKYRHFIPQSSFIGMLLAHDDDYTVIKSSRFSGMLQHDLATWQIKDGEPVVTKLSILGKMNDRGLADLVLRITDEQSDLINAVTQSLIDSSGEKDLTGLVKNAAPSFRGINAAWRSLDSDMKKKFLSLFKGSTALVVGAVRKVHRESLAQLRTLIQARRTPQQAV